MKGERGVGDSPGEFVGRVVRDKVDEIKYNKCRRQPDSGCSYSGERVGASVCLERGFNVTNKNTDIAGTIASALDLG